MSTFRWQRLFWSIGLMIVLLFLAAPVQAEPIAESAPQTLFQIGITALRQQQYETALTALTQVIQQDDQFGAAYSDRCLVNLQLDRLEDAIADCSQALALHPYNPEDYLNRGLAFFRAGDANQAIADYDQLLKFRPSDFRARYNRGLAYFELGDYRRAIVDYGESLRETMPLDYTSLSEIHSDRGLSELMLEDYQGAIADFSQAIYFNSKNARAYYNRACTNQRQGETARALADFSQVIALSADYPDAYLSRGLIYQQMGKQQEAMMDLQHAAQQFQAQGAIAAYQQTLNLIEQIQHLRIAYG
jgi:tetratricopeptide (TPR) repeat protein